MNQKRIVGGVGAAGGIVAAFVGDAVPFVLSFFEGSLDPDQMGQLGRMLEVLALAIGGYVLASWNTPDAPLRSAMPRSIVLVALTGAFVLPGITGCQTIEALGDLDNVGAVDVAIEAALDATEEGVAQRERIIAEIEAGELDPLDGRREFNRIGVGIRAVHAAVGAAEIGRRAGDADMTELAGDIMTEVGNLYRFIRSEVE